MTAPVSQAAPSFAQRVAAQAKQGVGFITEPASALGCIKNKPFAVLPKVAQQLGKGLFATQKTQGDSTVNTQLGQQWTGLTQSVGDLGKFGKTLLPYIFKSTFTHCVGQPPVRHGDTDTQPAVNGADKKQFKNWTQQFGEFCTKDVEGATGPASKIRSFLRGSQSDGFLCGIANGVKWLAKVFVAIPLEIAARLTELTLRVSWMVATSVARLAVSAAVLVAAAALNMVILSGAGLGIAGVVVGTALATPATIIADAAVYVFEKYISNLNWSLAKLGLIPKTDSSGSEAGSYEYRSEVLHNPPRHQVVEGGWNPGGSGFAGGLSRVGAFRQTQSSPPVGVVGSEVHRAGSFTSLADSQVDASDGQVRQPDSHSSPIPDSEIVDSRNAGAGARTEHQYGQPTAVVLPATSPSPSPDPASAPGTASNPPAPAAGSPRTWQHVGYAGA